MSRAINTFMHTMRELIRLCEADAKPIQFYHGTAASYLKKIKTNGIQPGVIRNFPNSFYGGRDRDRQIFLTKDLQMAFSYAENAAHIAGSKPIVLVVSIPPSFGHKVRPDSKDSASFATTLPIKPEWITDVLRESNNKGRLVEKFVNGIWIDPSRQQLLALAKRHSLRGTVIDGHLHVWNAADDTHYGVHSELVGYEEDYLGENDFMLGRLEDMEDWRPGEIEVAPGIFFSGKAPAEAHPVIQSLIHGTRTGCDGPHCQWP